MQKCIYCEAAVPENARFCGHCGQLMEARKAPENNQQSQLSGTSSFISEHDYPTFMNYSAHSMAEDLHTLPVVENNETERTIATEKLSSPQRSFDHELDQTYPMQRGSAYSNPNFSPVPALEEDEQEKRRRAMLLGGIVLDGAAMIPDMGGQSGNASMLRGTPQPGNASMFRGTPQPGNASMAHGVPGSPPLQSAPTVAPSHANMQMRDPRIVRPQAPPAHVMKRALSRRNRLGKALTRASSRWLIVASSAVIVLATAGIGIALASSPAISNLNGNHVVKLGNMLHLHGRGFFPGGHITMTRDNDHHPLSPHVPSITNTEYQQSSATLLHENAAFLLADLQAQNMQVVASSVSVDSAGTFVADIVIDNSWTPGQHIIYAQEDVLSRKANIAISVDAAPASLTVQPAVVQCGKLVKGVKAAVSLSLSNTGGQPLEWLIDAGATPWLTVQKQSGTLQEQSAPEAILVTCDTSKVNAGVYKAVIHVNSSATDQSVPVTLEVMPPPVQKSAKLSASDSSLDMGTLDQGNQGSQTLTLSNVGTDALKWQISSSVDWLSVDTSNGSIAAGGNPQKIVVQVDTTNLEKGKQTAQLSIHSNGGTSIVTVQVNVNIPIAPTPTPTPMPTPTPIVMPTPTPTPTVTPTPTPTPTVTPTSTPATSQLCKQPTSVDLGTIAYGSSQSTSINLSNCGGAILSWSLNDSRFNPARGNIDPGANVSSLLTVAASNNPGTCQTDTATFTTNESSGGGETIQISYCTGQSSPTPTPTPSPTPYITPSPTATPYITPSPTATPTPSPTATPTPSPTATPSPTPTPVPIHLSIQGNQRD